jgi:hypothetical protein
MKLGLVAVLVGSLTAGVTAQQGQAPAGETALGSVRLTRSVMADGKPLKAGTYQVRLTAQAASPAVPGQTMERWVEFVQGGKVAGREVVSIVPQSEMKDLMPGPDAGPRARAGGSRVEMLKGNEYVRVWINRGGVNYLIHMPPA